MKRLVLAAALPSLLICGCGPPTLEDEMGYRQQAVAEFQVGHLAEAKALLEQALYPDPSDPVALYYLGRIACEEGRWEEAIYRFQCCLSADPGHAEARQWLIRAERAAGVVGPKLRFVPLPPPPRFPVGPGGVSSTRPFKER
ncbi:MAG: tetratricopeptide repeat protein [Phycisphaerae bacterium]